MNLRKIYLEFVKNENKDKIIDMCRAVLCSFRKEYIYCKGDNERIGRMYRYKFRWKFNYQMSNGTIEEVMSGEVSVRGENGYV